MLGSYKRALVCTIIGFFCTLVILPLVETYGETVDVEVKYQPGTENSEELVWIEEIYLNRKIAFFDEYKGAVEYREEENQYRWDGFREVSLNKKIKRFDSLEFVLKYSENEETGKASDAVVNVLIAGKTYRLPLKTFYQNEKVFVQRGARLEYWFYCSGIFFVFFAVCMIAEKYIKSGGENKGTWSGKIKFCIRKIVYSPIFSLEIWAVAVRMYMNRWEWTYHVNNDTSSYLINSLSELSYIYRMPVYQIFLYLIKKIFQCETEDMLFQKVIIIQSVLGILSCALMWLALKKILKSECLAFIGAMVYASQPYIIYWERAIMTESLALDMIIGLILILACYLKKPNSWFAFSIGLYSFLLVMTRPSFLILFPVLTVFFLMKFFVSKEERTYTFWGGGGLILGIGFLLLYCGNNWRITGQFMLSHVSYDNEASIIISNGIYESTEYPEIMEAISRYKENDISSLNMSYKLYEECGGYPKVVKWIKSIIKEKPLEYFEATFKEWGKYQHKQLWYNPYELGMYFRSGYEGISRLLMPFSYLNIVVISIFEVFVGVLRWYRMKKAPWVEWGLSALILSIVVLGFMTLTFATPHRICVCVIPCTIILFFKIVENGMTQIIEV